MRRVIAMLVTLNAGIAAVGLMNLAAARPPQEGAPTPASSAAPAVPARPASSAAQPRPAAMVTMKSFMFSPAVLTVHTGETVIWRNLDGEPHTTVSIDGLFRSPALDENDSYSYRFTRPGKYQFICSIHPQMRGTIIVEG